jgi:hypothetical protein
MSLNDLMFWVFALVVAFLFYGDPDVWDRLHAFAMGVNCANP